MRARYNMLPDEFSTFSMQLYLGVTQRNAEKMIERWLSDGYIQRIESGRDKKLFLELT
jgi:DNA-binding MarR family transcriptional regulator